MNIEYVGRHFELNDEIRRYAENKLSKVTKFLDEPVETRIILTQEKHRQIADVHVAHRHGVLQAEEETEEMLDAINAAIDKIEKQARRGRQKFYDRRRRADRQNGENWPVDVLDAQTVGSGEKPRIIKSTELEIRPMSLDEAATELEGSKNDFVVFLDASTEMLNVLYKRKDENYGLIAPEF